jgi:DNA transformation protein
MARRSEFVDYIVELLEPLGVIRARTMFGGWGIYHDGRMIALVAEEMLYLKTDAVNRPEFEERGLPPFIYHKQGKEYATSYYQPPAEALDHPGQLRAWAEKAIAAATRAATKPAARRKRA